MVRVKNILGDDVYGRWHIEKIVIQKDGHRYAIMPDRKAFSTRDEAEDYAHTRAQRFVERKLGANSSTVQWRGSVKNLLVAAFVSVVMAVSVHWWTDSNLTGRGV